MSPDPTSAEPIEPAAPVEGTEPAEASQAPAAETAEAPEEREQTPRYATVDDLQGMEERIVKRTKQSLTDQMRTQLQGYEQFVKVQERSGTPIPPEAQERARQTILTEGLTGSEPTQATGQGMTDDQWGDYVVAQTNEVFKAVGVTVKKGDPEWALVEKAYTNPNISLAALLMEVQSAANAKKTRVASSKATAGARVGKGGGRPISPGDITNINDPATLYNMGEAEMRARKS